MKIKIAARDFTEDNKKVISTFMETSKQLIISSGGDKKTLLTTLDNLLKKAKKKKKKEKKEKKQKKEKKEKGEEKDRGNSLRMRMKKFKDDKKKE